MSIKNWFLNLLPSSSVGLAVDWPISTPTTGQILINWAQETEEEKYCSLLMVSCFPHHGADFPDRHCRSPPDTTGTGGPSKMLTSFLSGLLTHEYDVEVLSPLSSFYVLALGIHGTHSCSRYSSAAAYINS